MPINRRSKAAPKRRRLVTPGGEPTRYARSKQNKRTWHRARQELGANERPPKFWKTHPPDDRELARVIDAIAGGKTLQGICRELKIDPGTVRARFRDDTKLFTLYVRAREMQAEAWADQLVEEADETIDYAKDGANVEVQHKKFKAEVRKWLMARNHVKRFGDRLALAGDEDAPIRTINAGMPADEAAELYAQTIKKRPRT